MKNAITLLILILASPSFAGTLDYYLCSPGNGNTVMNSSYDYERRVEKVNGLLYNISTFDDKFTEDNDYSFSYIALGSGSTNNWLEMKSHSFDGKLLSIKIASKKILGNYSFEVNLNCTNSQGRIECEMQKPSAEIKEMKLVYDIKKNRSFMVYAKFDLTEFNKHNKTNYKVEALVSLGLEAIADQYFLYFFESVDRSVFGDDFSYSYSFSGGNQDMSNIFYIQNNWGTLDVDNIYKNDSSCLNMF